MTIADARKQARRYSRTSSTQATDSEVDNLIQDAIDEMANDVGGFPVEAYLSIAAKFTTKTNFAIRVTITGGTNALAATDVVVTGTARTETTGTIAAADFQTTLRTAIGGGANATVTWTDFYFTVDTIDGTAITFEAPTTTTYADARDLFGLTGTTTEANADHTGSFPQDCTMEASLPSDAITVERMEWDYDPIKELPREYALSPESKGTPRNYVIRGRDIRLVPSPTTQGIWYVEYRGTPTAVDFDTDVSLPTAIPGTYQQAIPHLVASKLLEEQWQHKEANFEYAKYHDLVRKYKTDYFNRNTQVDMNNAPGRLPRVVI